MGRDRITISGEQKIQSIWYHERALLMALSDIYYYIMAVLDYNDSLLDENEEYDETE